MKNKKIILSIVFLIHFFVIIAFNLMGMADLALKKKLYINKVISHNTLQKAHDCLSTILLSNTNTSNEYSDFYMNTTGDNTFFNHFSGMASFYKIIFEIEFNDSSRKTILPDVNCVEAGLRLNNLYSTIATTNNELYREVLLKRMAGFVCRSFSDIKKVNAVVGNVETSPLKDINTDSIFHFRQLYQYNFTIKQ